MADILPREEMDVVTFEDLAEYADRVGLRPERTETGYICCRLFCREEGEQASITVSGGGLSSTIRKAMPMIDKMLREGWRLL